MARSTERRRFDAAYYRRFYGRADTRVSGPAAVRRLATFVVSYLRYLDLPIRSVLDLGCGLGHWRKAMARLSPAASYRGVEISDYLCERHGWENGSVVDYRSSERFDLVVCQGVLQYLDDRKAARAISNLASLTRGALYLEALTARDWRENCDREVTDGDVHLRDGDWYLERLRRHFVPVGGGLYVHRNAGVVSFELEVLG